MKAAFRLFIYIVSLITIISCSSKQTDVDYPASSPLIKDLQDLNATIQSEFSVHTKASAKAIAAVAIADINGAYGGAKGGAKVGAYIGSLLGSPIYGAAVGALVGGIAIGATCSWAASPDTKSTQIMDFSHVIGVCEWAMHEDGAFEECDWLVPDEGTVNNTILNPESIKIGRLHNLMLAGLVGDVMIETDYLDTKSSTQDGDLEMSILSSQEMQDLFEEVTRNVSNGDIDIDDSLPSSVLGLFLNVFESCTEDCEDVSVIINKYQRIIQDSNELNTEEKQYLCDAFATALYSFNFWSGKQQN